MTQELLMKWKCCISNVDVDYGMREKSDLSKVSLNGQWELTRAVAFPHLSQAQVRPPLEVSLDSSPPLPNALW